jgi:hypothetical protein
MEHSGLTFDWDDVDIKDESVIYELNKLYDIFGKNKVWYRESSSKTGLHIMIAELKWDLKSADFILEPEPMNVDKQLKYREECSIECRGRMFSDLFRKEMGLRTSRVFAVKNGNNVNEWKTYNP